MNTIQTSCSICTVTCICVLMYMQMYTHVYVCECMCACACVYVCRCVCLYVCLHACMYVHTSYMYICIWALMMSHHFVNMGTPDRADRVYSPLRATACPHHSAELLTILQETKGSGSCLTRVQLVFIYDLRSTV